MAGKTSKEEGEPMKGVRIARRIYSFDVRKRFENVKNYTPLLAGSQEMSASNVRDVLAVSMQRLFGGKPKPKGESKAEMKVKALPTRVVNRIIFMALAFFGVFLIALLGLYLFIISAPFVPVQTLPNITVMQYAWINETGVLSYGMTSEYATYATVGVYAEYANLSVIELGVYSKPVPKNVYLLKSKYEQAEKNGKEFKSALYAEMNLQGIGISEIGLDQLTQLPENSEALVIVPTGFMPTALLGLEGEGSDLLELVKNGTTIIYMGYGFDEGVLNSEGNVEEFNSSLIRSYYGFDFENPRNRVPSGFYLRVPLYSVRGGDKAAITDAKDTNGSMSVVSYGGGKGAILFVPQTLDAGWARGAYAAADVAKLVRSVAWQEPLASSYEIVYANASNSVLAYKTIFAAPQNVREGYAKVFVETLGVDNATTGQTFVWKLNPRAEGELRHEPSKLSTSISAAGSNEVKELRVNVLFGEENDDRQHDMYLVVIQDGYELAKEFIQKTRPTSRLQYDYPLELASGKYLLRVVSETGYEYAASYLRVPEITVKNLGYGWKANYYEFEVDVDGKPVDVTNVRVNLDGADEQVLATENQVLTYKIEGKGGASEGKHRFNFTIGGTEVLVEETYAPVKDFWENPLLMFGFVFVAVIFGIGMLLKRPEKELYRLDVPDFPPLSKIRVPVPRKSVLAILEQVNKDYRWSYMPLKLEEIKGAFRSITREGRPILIGDYNLERLLETLGRSGEIVSYAGYYALKKWISDSKRSMKYLVMFRQLRDVFVNIALQFTDMGVSREADTEITTKSGKRIFVNIYESGQEQELLKRTLANVAKGRAMIIFENEAEKREFEHKMSSTSKAMVIMKMQYEQGDVILSTVSNLKKVLVA
ncbi:MAG: hypothetical protein ABIH99_05105 [Candidatus Micrarchaeota archaeon]